MHKTKNFNVILAIIFSAITCAISIFSLIYIIDKYPVGFNGLSLFTSGVLLFASSLLLLVGICISKKALIALSGILLSIYSIIYAVFFILRNAFSNIYYFTIPANGYGIDILQLVFMIIPAIAFLFVFLYSFGIMKNKKILLFSLFITWIILFISSLTSGLAPELFLVSTYILLLMYTNVSDISSPVRMGEVFCLSIVTFEIYYVYWCIKTVKKAAYLLKKDVTLSELILFTFFLPYASYWYYTRYEDLNSSEYEVKNRGTICMILTLLFFHPVSLCILQRDLNLLSETIVPEEIISETEEDFEIEENNSESTYDNAEDILSCTDDEIPKEE